MNRTLPFLLGHLLRPLAFFYLLPLLLLPGHLILDEMVVGPPGQGSQDLWRALLFLTACLSPLLGAGRLLPLLRANHTAPLLRWERIAPFNRTFQKALALLLATLGHLSSLWLSGLLLFALWGCPPQQPWTPLLASGLLALTACVWALLTHAHFSAAPALFLAGAGLTLGYLLPPLAQAISPQTHPLAGTFLALLSLPVPDLAALEQALAGGDGFTLMSGGEWLCKCGLLLTLATRERRP